MQHALKKDAKLSKGIEMAYFLAFDWSFLANLTILLINNETQLPCIREDQIIVVSQVLRFKHTIHIHRRPKNVKVAFFGWYSLYWNTFLKQSIHIYGTHQFHDMIKEFNRKSDIIFKYFQNVLMQRFFLHSSSCLFSLCKFQL